MKFSLVNLLQALIAFQGLCFAVHLLVGRRGKLIANRCLAALLSLLGVQMASNVVLDAGIVGDWILIPKLFALLYGPLFYFYVRSLAYRSARLGPEQLLHGVPFVALVIIWATDDLTIHTLAITIFASIGSYVALCFLVLRHYRGVLHETRSQKSLQVIA
jgi:hypothetical protein